MTFRVENPNKWLAHMSTKHPDDAAGFDDVSNIIDDLRTQIESLTPLSHMKVDWSKEHEGTE